MKKLLGILVLGLLFNNCASVWKSQSPSSIKQKNLTETQELRGIELWCESKDKDVNVALSIKFLSSELSESYETGSVEIMALSDLYSEAGIPEIKFLEVVRYYNNKKANTIWIKHDEVKFLHKESLKIDVQSKNNYFSTPSSFECSIITP